MSWVSDAWDAVSSLWESTPSNIYPTANGDEYADMLSGAASSSSSDGGGFLSDIFGGVSSIFGSKGFGEGLAGIGSAYINSNQPNPYSGEYLDYLKARDAAALASEEKWRSQYAGAMVAAANAGANAQVAAANVAAQSADRRAKLEALMGASGRRIDANFTGTGQKLAAVQEMMRAAGRKY